MSLCGKDICIQEDDDVRKFDLCAFYFVKYFLIFPYITKHTLTDLPYYNFDIRVL
jgi:hypothetical protein